MVTKNQKVKTRIAPSPTGMVHIGNLRTALYNYLFAQQNKGEFVLRVEDTDQTRKVEGAIEKVLEMLEWSGLKWDGEITTQSDRLDIYKKYADELVKDEKAYYCFCTPEELNNMRESQKKHGRLIMYNQNCRNLKQEVVDKNLKDKKPYVIRLKVPEYEDDKKGKEKEHPVKFKDLVWGNLEFYRYAIDDQVLIKSDGFPTYHLAVVVDDHEMNITHIMRGEDWLPSTPKHVLLYQAFGWEMPKFIHLPNILGEGKKKLSKRTGDVSVEDFKDKGYLPEALINYLALLGWNPGTEQEIFSMKELIKEFDIKKIHKAGAIFDIKKLDNINGQYIRKLDIKKLVKLCLPYLKDVKAEKEYIKKVVLIEQDRLKKLSDITENTKLFFTDKLEYDTKLLIWKKSDTAETKKKLIETKKKLMEIEAWNKENLEKEVLNFITENSLTNGEVLWPLRVALSGQQNSPGPFEIADVLGKEESLKRVESAVKKLN